MSITELKKKIKKAYPGVVFRYTYITDIGEKRLVFRGKNYEHYEFTLLGNLVAFEE